MNEVIGKELAAALKALAQLAYPKEDRPHLNCIRMDGGVWAATNGHACMLIEVEADVDATISLKSVKELIPLAKSDALPWQIDTEEKRFVSASRDISLSWASPGEDFPDWRKILPRDGRTPSNPSFSAPLMKQCTNALCTLGLGGVMMHTGPFPEAMLLEAVGSFGDFVKSARVILMPCRTGLEA